MRRPSTLTDRRTAVAIARTVSGPVGLLAQGSADGQGRTAGLLCWATAGLAVGWWLAGSVALWSLLAPALGLAAPAGITGLVLVWLLAGPAGRPLGALAVAAGLVLLAGHHPAAVEVAGRPLAPSPLLVLGLYLLAFGWHLPVRGRVARAPAARVAWALALTLDGLVRSIVAVVVWGAVLVPLIGVPPLAGPIALPVLLLGLGGRAGGAVLLVHAALLLVSGHAAAPHLPAGPADPLTLAVLGLFGTTFGLPLGAVLDRALVPPPARPAAGPVRVVDLPPFVLPPLAKAVRSPEQLVLERPHGIRVRLRQPGD